MTAPSVGEVMALISPPVGKVLAALNTMPRTKDWLTRELEADPRRMDRLKRLGLVEQRPVWFDMLRLWLLSKKGAAWLRVWSDEMDRREAASAIRGLSWAPGEEPQPGDQVIEFDTGVKGMRAGLRIVPHNRRAVDVVYEEPPDMVAALGLLEEGNAVSLQYLVGANSAEGATTERMEAIMEILEGRGCAVREGHGWVRTPMGTRWHQTWSGAEGSAT